ncbi:sensor histidine kinase [Novosphingobium guangzhouense]|uniref:histidine kinase n=1 Tax=Novosphingobium guangzhouense TaxID=1850347 RepID=A0A2K2G5R7_9SPHN|nr:DUF4118 domain-containing protein [Novosphingobium guangzhouense]PNU06385.1 histidine kinase [Novosphingobium guangzhouense]
MYSLSRFTERLPFLPDRPGVRYTATIALCLFALWLRWALDSAFPPGYPFLTFFPAVILSSFLFGPRPGVLAAILCGIFAWYVFIPPRMTFGFDHGTITAMLFYTGVVAVDIALVHFMQAANARLHHAREEVRTLAEERRQLAERSELLFQEMQHRVGNNLQMVGAVLSLQMRNLQEPVARRALSDAAARLQVIGNIQRQLYHHDGRLVPLDRFLQEVCAKTMSSSARPGITCSVEALGDIVLRPDSAVPVALIVTEAIANAIEHGFADDRDGTITVRVTRQNGGVVLHVEDDGHGLPPGFDPASADSIGLRISRVLSRQLEARIALENAQAGTRMTLELPPSRLAEGA